MMTEAMSYAVQIVNNNSESLHGYTFKINKIHHSERFVGESVLQSFLSRIPFIIGAYSPETSYMTNVLAKVFSQVTVSYSAVYSDFDAKPMFRTVFSNVYRVQALLHLVKRLGWNYLAVISSYGRDGDQDATKFISKFSNTGACLIKKILLPQERNSNDECFDNATASLQEDHRLKTIVLFTTNDDSRRIMLAFKRKKLEGFYRIICAFGCTNYMEVVEGIEDVALGTISLDIHYKSESKFETYF